MNIKALQEAIHNNAIAHGWWEEERTFGELIALCHSELSEALEEFRKGQACNITYCGNYDPQSCDSYFVENHKCNQQVCSQYKPEGIPIELADTVIRIMDMCEFHGIDLEAAILEKHKFNLSRPYKHGGKVI